MTAEPHKHPCNATVWHDMHRAPCSRDGTVERNGVWWCKQHDPEAKKLRDKASRERSDAEWRAKRERWHVERHALPAIGLLRAIAGGLNDPRAAAEKFIADFEADHPAQEREAS